MSKEPVAKRDMRIKLDWQAYFKEFMVVHGEPVIYQKRMLFADAYRHAMNYRGPEIPPPQDEEKRVKLKIEYWKIRLQIHKAEAEELESEITALKALEKERSVPLFFVSQEPDKDGQVRKVSKPLVIQAQLERLDWLKNGVRYAEIQIEMLKEHGDVDDERLRPEGNEYLRSRFDGSDSGESDGPAGVESGEHHFENGATTAGGT